MDPQIANDIIEDAIISLESAWRNSDSNFERADLQKTIDGLRLVWNDYQNQLYDIELE